MTGTATQPDGSLRLLFWESTARCNLACIHCRRLDAVSSDDLTVSEFKAVLASAATLGNPIVVFSGGEPLLRDDWEELAACAASLGLPTAMATNGTLIDEPTARRIAGAGFRRVAVSLDGADAATHDGFRAVPGAFAKAMAGIAHLRAAGVLVQVNATIAAHNAHQLDGLHDLAVRLGAAALHLFLLVPVGCGVQIAETHQLTPARYEQVLAWVCDRIAASPRGDGAVSHGPEARAAMELRATCAPHFHRVASARGMPTGGSRGCLCGLSVIFVSHRGDVFPCGYLPVSCGSVRQRPLADIWRDSPVLGELRDFTRTGGKCGRCEYRAVCGGCRARAFADTGDYLAEEPACMHQPNPRTANRKSPVEPRQPPCL